VTIRRPSTDRRAGGEELDRQCAATALASTVAASHFTPGNEGGRRLPGCQGRVVGQSCATIDREELGQVSSGYNFERLVSGLRLPRRQQRTSDFLVQPWEHLYVGRRSAHAAESGDVAIE